MIARISPQEFLEGRRLIYVPVLHSQQDMGTLAEPAKKFFIDKLSQSLWERHLKAIEDMWAGIRKKLEGLSLPYERTFVYQDGLPVCGKETQIISELAGKGNPNHRIIQSMIERGALIQGTENPGFLIEEYNGLKQIMTCEDPERKKELLQRYQESAKELLTKRDRFISERIDKTLARGSVGVLFMGLLHRVDELLPADIQVNYLIYRLPFQRSFEMALVP